MKVKDSFDKLVAGLSEEERINLLDKINRTTDNIVQFEKIEKESNVRIVLSDKIKNESFLYRIFIWIKSLFLQKSDVSIYNDDLISRIARKIQSNYPSVINHKQEVLDFVFFERLKDLRIAAEFFKPYLLLVANNSGEFYVFLSTIVTPELSEKIKNNVNPFSIPFSKEPGNELRAEIFRKLDDQLNNMDSKTKNAIYYAVAQIDWLQDFSSLTFLHFLSQFTNVSDERYTCPYQNACIDYDKLASVFLNIIPIQNEVLEALFLFSQKKNIDIQKSSERDIENAIREFLSIANGNLSVIKQFISSVPIEALGRVINEKYDWESPVSGSIEPWFPAFRSEWRSVIESRWNKWVLERKKSKLLETLNKDFGLENFPLLPDRPWKKLWSRVNFTSELTAGLLAWFYYEKYDFTMQVLSDVAMEGIFLRSENRTEFSNTLHALSVSMSNLEKLLLRISKNGEYGQFLYECENNKIHSLQVQNQIDSTIASISAETQSVISEFCSACRTFEPIFKGFFDDEKDGIHEGLQNLSLIKSRSNQDFKDNLRETRRILKRMFYYISELEPLTQVETD